MYAKTHGDYFPGEQKKRDYKWEEAKIDPNSHCFGFVERNRVFDGVNQVYYYFVHFFLLPAFPSVNALIVLSK